MSAQAPAERTAFEAWWFGADGFALHDERFDTPTKGAWAAWQERASQPAAAVAVPAGWKLAPIEPAEAMLRDGAAAIWGPMLLGPHYRGLAGKAYAAMLSAAPASAAVPAEQQIEREVERHLREVAKQGPDAPSAHLYIRLCEAMGYTDSGSDLSPEEFAARLAAPASAAVEGEPMSIDDPRMYSAVHAPYVGPVVLVDVAKLMDPQATKGCA